jgi:hypothetical protein
MFRDDRAQKRELKVVFDFIGNGDLHGVPCGAIMGTVQDIGRGHPEHRVTLLVNQDLETIAGECDCIDFEKTRTWAEIAQPRHPHTHARVCYHMRAAELAYQSQRGQEG